MAKVQHETPKGFKRRALPGSLRVTYQPSVIVRATHQRFLNQTASNPLYFSDPGKDVAAHVHKGHRYYFSTDLSSAFDQVTLARLRKALAFRSIKPGWLTPPSHFFHEEGRGGLIQGAPSSSYLFEIYCRFGGLDRDILEYCDKLGFQYSRYVDDILVSSLRPLGKRVGPTIRRIVSQYGFSLSDHKTKRVDVQSEPLRALGYVIRGSRIDADQDVLQALFNPDTSEESRTGLFAWKRHVRGLNKHRG